MKKKVSPFIALQFKDFRLLWVGMFISQIGSQMQIVGVDWHIYSITKSPISLGLIGLVGFISVLLFSLIGGVVADRYDRKRLMIGSQVILGISSVILGVTTHLGLINPFIIYAAMAINSAVNTFDLPARQSLMPSLVPKQYFMNAVSLMSLMRQTAVILGFSLSGFIIAFYGVKAIYFFNAVTFIFSILSIVFIQVSSRDIEKRPAISLASILEGVHFVRKTPLIYSTMLLDFFATFFASATVLLPIYAQDILHVGPQGLGFLYASISVGSMLAAIILSGLGHIKSQGKLLIAGVILYGIATVGFGLIQTFFAAVFFLALIGAGDMISTIIRNTVRQLATPDHLRGRMVSVNMIFFSGGPKLGEMEAGFAAAFFGTPQSVVIGGVGTIIATVVIAVWRPQLWKYKGDDLAV